MSRARLALADWTVFLTNAPVDLLSLSDALVLGRARWQIELLFRLWKTHGEIDQSRSHKPWRILAEVYAKLIGMIIQHWIMLVSCWSHPDHSLVKAAATIRDNASLLVAGLSGWLPIRTAIQILKQAITSGCRLNPRRKHPDTYQLLLNPSAYA